MTTLSVPPGMEGLRVSLAVPDSPSYLHPQDREGVAFLHAVVLNISDRPLKVWAEDCSAGNANLTLEILTLDILAMGGETLSEPIIVSRRPTAWLQNRIRKVPLEPGEAVVRAVRLHQYQPGQRETSVAWSDHIHYLGFPVLAGSYGYEVQLRAVFTSGGDERARADGLWDGRAVSEVRGYRVWGPYR